MSITTLVFFLAMYLYGYSLMIWVLFFDKRPTKASITSAKVGLIVLTATLIYCVYALWTVGLKS